MSVSNLPMVNASLNGLSTVFILAGIVFIMNDRKQAHFVSMMCALVTSAAFLACYLTYHFLKGVVHPIYYPGWPKMVYFAILLTHTSRWPFSFCRWSF